MKVLRLNADGSIQPVVGSPFPYPSNPLAIAGSYLIAGSNSSIAVYAVDPPTGTVTKVSPDVPGGVSVASDGNFAYVGAEDAIYGYALQGGQLTPVPGSPFAQASAQQLLCGCATPVYGYLQIAQGYLFDGINADHGGSGFEARKIGADGSVGNSVQIENGGTEPGTGGIVASNGRFVYTIDSSEVQLFDFDPASGKSNFVSAVTDDLWNSGVVDATNAYLFTTNQNEVHSYGMDSKTGMLSLAATMAAANSYPQAVDPDHKYLLTFDKPPASAALTAPYGISVWSIDWSTGALTKVGSYSLGPYSSSYAPGGFIVGKFQ